MQSNLLEFLRHGGSGQYILARQNGAVYGYRTGISIKSFFPGYVDLQVDFADQLDRVIADNTRMLLNALTQPDTVPWLTEADLRDVSDAKEEVLRQWDARLTAIFEEYETHPQRLRPLRAAMEERLLRAFAGLISFGSRTWGLSGTSGALKTTRKCATATRSMTIKCSAGTNRPRTDIRVRRTTVGVIQSRSAPVPRTMSRLWITFPQPGAILSKTSLSMRLGVAHDRIARRQERGFPHRHGHRAASPDAVLHGLPLAPRFFQFARGCREVDEREPVPQCRHCERGRDWTRGGRFHYQHLLQHHRPGGI